MLDYIFNKGIGIIQSLFGSNPLGDDNMKKKETCWIAIDGKSILVEFDKMKTIDELKHEDKPKQSNHNLSR